MARSRRLGRPDQNYIAPGGRLHSLLGAAFGMPGLQGSVANNTDEADPNTITPEAEAYDTGVDPDTLGVTNTQAASLNPPAIAAVQAPQFKKPGFWANLLSKGEAGTNYKRLQGSLAATGYEAKLKEALNQQTRAAMLQQAQAVHLNKLMEEKTKISETARVAKELEDLKFGRLPEEEKIKAAYKNNVNPQNFSEVEQTALAKLAGERAGLNAVQPLYGTPAYNKSFQDKLFAENAAPGVKNILDQSSALRNQFLDVAPNHLALNLKQPSVNSFMSLGGDETITTPLDASGYPTGNIDAIRAARSPKIQGYNPFEGTLLTPIKKQQTPDGQKVSDVVNAAPTQPIQPKVTIPTTPENPFGALPTTDTSSSTMLDQIINYLRRAGLQP